MKQFTILTMMFLGLFCSNLNAQWTNVGMPGFSTGGADHEQIEVYNDTLYVAFRDLSNSSKITVMKYDGSAWVNVGMPGFTSVASSLDFAINSIGELYIAYQNNSNSDAIDVMKYENSTWNLVGTANISNGTSQRPSIAFDAANVPHVAYLSGANFPTFDVLVKKFNGTSWTFLGNSVYTSGFPPPDYLDLVFGPGNLPYLAFSNGSGTVIKRYNGSSWVNFGSGSVLTANDGQFQSLTFDQNGDGHIAFRDLGNSSKTTVIKYTGGTWAALGTAGFTAGSTTYHSIASNNGTIYVAQIEQSTTANAAVYTYNGSTWSFLGGGPAASGSKNFTDMVISNNVVYLVFQDILSIQQATVMKYDLNTAIEKIETINNSITVYPNPATDLITVKGETPINSVSILSIEGKLIESVNDATFSVAELPQGVYLLEVHTEKGIGHKTFVKE